MPSRSTEPSGGRWPQQPSSPLGGAPALDRRNAYPENSAAVGTQGDLTLHSPPSVYGVQKVEGRPAGRGSISAPKRTRLEV